MQFESESFKKSMSLCTDLVKVINEHKDCDYTVTLYALALTQVAMSRKLAEATPEAARLNAEADAAFAKLMSSLDELIDAEQVSLVSASIATGLVVSRLTESFMPASAIM